MQRENARPVIDPFETLLLAVLGLLDAQPAITSTRGNDDTGESESGDESGEIAPPFPPIVPTVCGLSLSVTRPLPAPC